MYHIRRLKTLFYTIIHVLYKAWTSPMYMYDQKQIIMLKTDYQSTMSGIDDWAADRFLWDEDRSSGDHWSQWLRRRRRFFDGSLQLNKAWGGGLWGRGFGRALIDIGCLHEGRPIVGYGTLGLLMSFSFFKLHFTNSHLCCYIALRGYRHDITIMMTIMMAIMTKGDNSEDD